jgi:hypothetical protein
MPTIKRTRAFLAVFAVIIAVVAFAGPASAEPYTHKPTISVSSEHPKAGSRLTVCGWELTGKRVTITLDHHITLVSVVVNHSGHFCTTIWLPDNVTGKHLIVAEGAEGHSASALIHIVGRASGHGGGDQGVGDHAGGTSSSVQVLGVSLNAPAHVGGVSVTASVPARASVPLKVAGVSASAIPKAVGTGLAFTGADVIGIGALAVLLLLGGGVMRFARRRRKVTI